MAPAQNNDAAAGRPVILIVEDDAFVRRVIRLSLAADKRFECRESANVWQAENRMARERVDLILLDWMLDETSGIEWLRQLRRNDATKDMPVIMLTARGEGPQRIEGLQAGADDYIAKPFLPRELRARIDAVLRRCAAKARPAQRDPAAVSLRVGDMVLDCAGGTLTIRGRRLRLRRKELLLLRCFFSDPVRILTRAELLAAAWSDDTAGERIVDVYVRRLRLILATNPQGGKAQADSAPHNIETVRGVGYRLAPCAEAAERRV